MCVCVRTEDYYIVFFGKQDYYIVKGDRLWERIRKV